MNLLLLDNYDSFTFNLYHLFGSLGPKVEVIRNDAATVADLMARNYDAIILSPGPCTPDEAGIMLDLIGAAKDRVPLFGVCLGHQAIGQSFGGKVVRAPAPMHGKVSPITHSGRGLFRGINGPFAAARYHSLVVERATLSPDFDIAAEADGLIMAASHRTLPIHGVQFHPESIASEHGATMCRNFLDLAGEWSRKSKVA
jgi:anthranilate synthase component 2